MKSLVLTSVQSKAEQNRIHPLMMKGLVTETACKQTATLVFNHYGLLCLMTSHTFVSGKTLKHLLLSKTKMLGCIKPQAVLYVENTCTHIDVIWTNPKELYEIDFWPLHKKKII